jgi:hypothetical protein
MTGVRRSALILLALAFFACEMHEGSRGVRPASELSTNGWVELTLVDRNVPSDPVRSGAGERERPPTCKLVVDFDGESVLSEVLRPTGALPPYSVESTFRFPAPPGDHGAAVIYSGCRTFGDRLDSVEAVLRISVRRRHVTRMRFDGSVLEADAPSDSLREPSPR